MTESAFDLIFLGLISLGLGTIFGMIIGSRR